MFLEQKLREKYTEAIKSSLEQLPISSPFPPKLTTSIYHSSTKKWHDNGTKKIFLRERPKRKTFIPLTAKYRRSKHELDTTSRSTVDQLECANNTFTIKYEDEYKVWNNVNFSIMHQNQVYHYDAYRVTDDALQVCDHVIQQRWRKLTKKEKKSWLSNNVMYRWTVFSETSTNYTKTLLFSSNLQSKVLQGKIAGVIFKHFAICSAKLSLSCNDHLVKVKYSEKYKVFKNFALSYRKNRYDYREY